MAFLLVFGRDSSCFGAKTDRKLHSQPRIHRFRLQRQHPEHALVHPAQRLAGDEPLQRLQAAPIGRQFDGIVDAPHRQLRGWQVGALQDLVGVALEAREQHTLPSAVQARPGNIWPSVASWWATIAGW